MDEKMWKSLHDAGARCPITRNLCGTDTVAIDRECPGGGECANAKIYRAGREAGMREAAIDADAATRYGKTAQAHGFSNAPPWSELAEETKQLYRDAIPSAIEGAK